MSYEKREALTLERIADIICKLDENCERIENTDGRKNHFFEREKAIHEIRQLIYETKKAERLERKREQYIDNSFAAELGEEAQALAEIFEHFDRLEMTLCKLDDVESKIKGYFEQRKALHEVKRILHCIGKLDKYDEKDKLAVG